MRNLSTNKKRSRNITVFICDYLRILALILFAHCFTYILWLLEQSYATPKKVEHVPLMQDYLVSEIYPGVPADLLLSSYAGAKKYRTSLREGVKNGPNYAGHYTVIQISQGSNCQLIWVIDAITGAIITKPFSTNWGAKYNLNSKLLILDPVPDDADESYFKSALFGVDSRYLVMDDGKLHLIFKKNQVNLLQEILNERKRR
jgi:hypothetical protein